MGYWHTSMVLGVAHVNVRFSYRSLECSWAHYSTFGAWNQSIGVPMATSFLFWLKKQRKVEGCRARLWAWSHRRTLLNVLTRLLVTGSILYWLYHVEGRILVRECVGNIWTHSITQLIYSLHPLHPRPLWHLGSKFWLLHYSVEY